MALGADRSAVIRMELAGALRLTGVGLLLGCPGVLIGAHLFKSQLFGVKPADPKAIVLAIEVPGATSLIAAYVPARRAASIDPIRALRSEGNQESPAMTTFHRLVNLFSRSG
jgi:ABC-type antimicrobial peptide transport system permease subunit